MLTDAENTPDQTRLARLGYRAMIRGLWDVAKDKLRRYQLRSAARDLAKAAEGYLRYRRAAVAARFR
jgi:hypothetical protein